MSAIMKRAGQARISHHRAPAGPASQRHRRPVGSKGPRRYHCADAEEPRGSGGSPRLPAAGARLWLDEHAVGVAGRVGVETDQVAVVVDAVDGGGADPVRVVDRGEAV